MVASYRESVNGGWRAQIVFPRRCRVCENCTNEKPKMNLERHSRNQITRVRELLCARLTLDFRLQGSLCRLKPELRTSPQRRRGRPWERTLPARLELPTLARRMRALPGARGGKSLA